MAILNPKLKWLLAALFTLQAAAAFAHPPGLSSLDLSNKAGSVDVKATLALQDIEAFAPMDSDLDAEVTGAEREAAKPGIAKLLAEQFTMEPERARRSK